MIKIHLSRILGERRISQRQLAEMSGVRPNAISELYNEERNAGAGRKEPIKRIDLDILNRICTTLKIQPGELLEWVPDEE